MGLNPILMRHRAIHKLRLLLVYCRARGGRPIASRQRVGQQPSIRVKIETIMVQGLLSNSTWGLWRLEAQLIQFVGVINKHRSCTSIDPLEVYWTAPFTRLQRHPQRVVVLVWHEGQGYGGALQHCVLARLEVDLRDSLDCSGGR